jgi:hypothetical protein
MSKKRKPANRGTEAPDEHPLLEAVLENIEAGVNLISGNEVLAAIPVVGTAFKVCRGIDDMRARMFIAKLERFVTDPSLQSEAAKEALKRAAANPSAESHKIGESLFLILERLTDLEKPSLLARIFAGYLGGKITSEELRRLAPAIDAAFLEDINQLLADPDPRQMDAAPWKRSLVVAGLTEQNAPGPIGGRLVYMVTPLGQALRTAVT